MFLKSERVCVACDQCGMAGEWYCARNLAESIWRKDGNWAGGEGRHRCARCLADPGCGPAICSEGGGSPKNERR